MQTAGCWHRHHDDGLSQGPGGRYNGNASGLDNTCDRDEPGNCGCLHSEENAVINCDAPRATRKYVFVSHLPCVACAKRLINLGNVEKVVYLNDYRKTESIDLLESVGIRVERFGPAET